VLYYKEVTRGSDITEGPRVGQRHMVVKLMNHLQLKAVGCCVVSLFASVGVDQGSVRVIKSSISF